jgi:hypothetical protein
LLGKPAGLGYISAYAILPLRRFVYVDSHRCLNQERYPCGTFRCREEGAQTSDESFVNNK